MRALVIGMLTTLLVSSDVASAGQGESDYGEPQSAVGAADGAADGVSDGAAGDTPNLEGCSACTLRHQNLPQRRKELQAAKKARGDCRIKGDITDEGGRVFYRPGDSRYELAWISEAEGEQWFCTAAEAEAAGWRSDGD